MPHISRPGYYIDPIVGFQIVRSQLRVVTRIPRRASFSMVVEEEKLDSEKMYSLIDKPYYVDMTKYKIE